MFYFVKLIWDFNLIIILDYFSDFTKGKTRCSKVYKNKSDYVLKQEETLEYPISKVQVNASDLIYLIKPTVYILGDNITRVKVVSIGRQHIL